MNRVSAWLCSACWAFSATVANAQAGNVWWIPALGVVVSLIAMAAAIYDLGRGRK